MTTESGFLNISAYRFHPIEEGSLGQIREQWRSKATSLGLKGTILMATEGVNFMLSGAKASIRTMQEELEKLPGFADLPYKESWSEYQPFNRMLVRIKKQVIPVDDPTISPAKETGPSLPASEFKTWLDEKRDILVLDTRNNYETRVGKFKEAMDLDIVYFREFENKIAEIPEEYKEKPVVMYCTGGIRCEKASPILLKNGFKEVYQLEGGILKYFEEAGGDHYEGDCFVFDRRAALSPDLTETEVTECYACREPLSPEQQQDKRYVVGASCPYCFKD